VEVDVRQVLRRPATLDQPLDQPGKEVAAEPGHRQVHGQAVTPAQGRRHRQHWHHQHVAELHDRPHQRVEHAGQVVDQPERIDLELVDVVAVHQLDRQQQDRDCDDQPDGVAGVPGQEQAGPEPGPAARFLRRHRAPPSRLAYRRPCPHLTRHIAGT
jgi:hypothetical protein